jgi:hypothetical protein
MVNALKLQGFDVPVDADIRLHFPMLNIISELLNRHLEINPYSELFHVDPSPQEEETISKMNAFLALLIPVINQGKKPNIGKLAKEAGVDPKLAAELVRNAMDSAGRLRK